MLNNTQLMIRDLAQQPYEPIWTAMREYVDSDQPNKADQLWLLEHLPIYTLGQNGKTEHILDPGDIPILNVDRGGQVTYHGPGQLITYILIDLKRKALGVKQLVNLLEQAIIDLLADWGITGTRREGAPGVYVNSAKICSLGLRVRRGWSYHGLSLNVDLDLEPFSRINPCGIPKLNMTQLSELGAPKDMAIIKPRLVTQLATTLGYEM